jgi:uncharacterized protein
MRVTVTGATGLLGSRLVKQLQARGDEVTVLSRSPERAKETLGDVEAHAWDLMSEPAPAAALAGRDAVVHLAGENLAQRWTDKAKREILESREQGTRRLVEALPDSVKTLVSASAVGYYGLRGAEEVTEDDPPGDDFPARVCVAWEREANKAGARVVTIRTGVVLDASGGALAQMLTPFKLGVGGPVAGGRQYLPWIHVDDVVGVYLAAIDGHEWDGPVNATAPEPVTNAVFSKALGRALHRPAILPVPGFALQLLYGDMSEMVTEGQRAVPNRAQALGYTWRHPDLDEALRDALS